MLFFKDKNDQIHALGDTDDTSVLPTDCIEIPEADAMAILNPPKSVADTATDKLAYINGKCEASIDALKAGYPDNEIRTWDKQETEARAYAADNTASVPFISGLANARGIPLADLVAKIIGKADAFIVATSAEIGKRQNLEDQINAVVSANALPPTDANGNPTPGYQDDATASTNIEAITW